MSFKSTEAVKTNPEEPVEEIAAAKAAGKCGECYACCAGYHEQCKGTDFNWEKELEAPMNLIRRTFWSSGLVTDREMFIDEDAHQEFIAEQRRRFTNGPGIDSVKLFDYRNRCYMIFAHEAGGK